MHMECMPCRIGDGHCNHRLGTQSGLYSKLLSKNARYRSVVEHVGAS